MHVNVQWKNGVQFDIEARGHHIMSDQPRESGGSDGGMTPPEFLLASLGACAAYYAAEYLRVRSLPQEGLQVRVHAEKAAQPARLGAFRIEVESPAMEEERHREGILRAVRRCVVHNTLLHAPAIEVIAAAAPVTI
ncbi:MAG: OsmC family protein [Bryobacteraceae bacterium]